MNTLLAWRETGATSVFGVNRQEDDLHAIQERTKEAILALDTFLRGDTIEDDGREVNLRTIRLIKGEIGTGLRLAEAHIDVPEMRETLDRKFWKAHRIALSEIPEAGAAHGLAVEAHD